MRNLILLLVALCISSCNPGYLVRKAPKDLYLIKRKKGDVEVIAKIRKGESYSVPLNRNRKYRYKNLKGYIIDAN